MSTREFFLAAWEWRPGTLALCGAIILAYGWVCRFRSFRGTALMLSGVGVLLLTLGSPLHALADDYLFSAHMVMHLLLLLVIPLLLVSSLHAGGAPGMKRPSAWPLVAWFVGLGAMWVWHQPALFEAAHTQPRIHELQIISLLAAGGFFWWPVFGPQLHRRLSPLSGIIYLFTACLGCTILGIGITFAPAGLFASYLSGEDPYGIRPIIRDSWGLTSAMDQQIGGLLMWVPPCLLYAGGIMKLLVRLYGEAEATAPEAFLKSPEENQRNANPEKH